MRTGQAFAAILITPSRAVRSQVPAALLAALGVCSLAARRTSRS
jgi:hypothetical protein